MLTRLVLNLMMQAILAAHLVTLTQIQFHMKGQRKLAVIANSVCNAQQKRKIKRQRRRLVWIKPGKYSSALNLC